MSPLSRPLLTLAALAMLFRGLLPAGYMLAPRAEFLAGAPVALCPAQSAELVAALARRAGAHAHHPHHHGHGDAAGTPQAAAGDCVYALAFAPAIGAGTAPASLALSSAPLAATPPRPAALAGARLAAYPRGPPLFS